MLVCGLSLRVAVGRFGFVVLKRMKGGGFLIGGKL